MNKITVVLANLMSQAGELNDETIARINLTSRLEEDRESRIILLCGWDYRPDCDVAIADAMRAYLLSFYPGLADKLICQRLSRDTVGDAVFSRICLGSLLDSPSSCAVNVVTSDYHAYRAKQIFEFVFGSSFCISVAGVTGFRRDNSAVKEAKSLAAFRKTFGNVVAGDLISIFGSLRNDHPFYNGKVHPRIGDFCDVSKSLLNSTSL